MPDRIIRDELLDSDRYLGLSSDTARLLFVHLLLVADDLGNAEASAAYIRRRVLVGNAPDETIAKLLTELADQDIIRLYQVGAKRYVHIPRFRQRLRSLKRINPRPPAAMECTEISRLASKLSDECPTDDGQVTGSCQSPAREGRKEVKEGKGYKPSARAPDPVDNSSSGDQQPGNPQPVGDKSPGKVNGNSNPATQQAGNPPRPARGVQDREGIEALARYFGQWPLTGRAGHDWGDALDFVNRLRAEHFRDEHA